MVELKVTFPREGEFTNYSLENRLARARLQYVGSGLVNKTTKTFIRPNKECLIITLLDKVPDHFNLEYIAKHGIGIKIKQLENIN